MRENDEYNTSTSKVEEKKQMLPFTCTSKCIHLEWGERVQYTAKGERENDRIEMETKQALFFFFFYMSLANG